MLADSSIRSCEPDSPNRCQAVSTNGQCWYQATLLQDGTFAKYCVMHGGAQAIKKLDKVSSNMYRLAKYQTRVDHFAKHDEVKGLRSEVGILRMVLEERLNSINDSNDLILQSNVISDLATKIEKVVTSCHKLETSMGQLLDRQQIVQFADVVIKIIGDHVTDPNVLQSIADRLMEATDKVLDGNAEQHAEVKQGPMRAELDG